MSDVAITNAATRINTATNTTGQRRRRSEVGDVVGGSVDWGVDMGKGDSGDHQPATVGSPSLGAPVRAAVLAGHEGDVHSATGLATHPEAAVRAAALGALERMGALATPMLVAAVTDAAPTVR